MMMLRRLNKLPIQLLKNEDLLVSVNASSSCTLDANLNSSDGRTVSIVENTPLSAGESVVRTLRWDTPGIVGGEARLTGEFTCGSSIAQQVSIDFHTIGLRLVNNEFKSDISSDDDGFVNVPLEFTGLGQQVWEVRLEGPVDRIATTAPTQNLGDGSKINLTLFFWIIPFKDITYKFKRTKNLSNIGRHNHSF